MYMCVHIYIYIYIYTYICSLHGQVKLWHVGLLKRSLDPIVDNVKQQCSTFQDKINIHTHSFYNPAKPSGRGGGPPFFGTCSKQYLFFEHRFPHTHIYIYIYNGTLRSLREGRDPRKPTYLLCVYIYIYIYIYIHMTLCYITVCMILYIYTLCIDLYHIHTYMYMYVYVCVHIYIYIYIYNNYTHNISRTRIHTLELRPERPPRITIMKIYSISFFARFRWRRWALAGRSQSVLYPLGRAKGKLWAASPSHGAPPIMIIDSNNNDNDNNQA